MGLADKEYDDEIIQDLSKPSRRRRKPEMKKHKNHLSIVALVPTDDLVNPNSGHSTRHIKNIMEFKSKLSSYPLGFPT